MKIHKLFAVTVTLLSLTRTEAAISYIESFKKLQDEVIWPTPLSDRHNISSTFGPRTKSSCSCYDFHRGIDIHGNIGEPIYAVMDGTVEKVTTYSSGGLTVILKHQFDDWTTLIPGHGNTKNLYTLYMHTNATYVVKGDAVEAGDHIADVGDTGSTVNPHLHMEVRVGTRCSLEYALTNTWSSCNTKNYDPHLVPFLLLPNSTDSNITVSVQTENNNTHDGILNISTPDSMPNVGKYIVRVVDTIFNTTLQEHTLDLNLRYGFDASSTAALDTPNTTVPYLDPHHFGYSADRWKIGLVIPSSWIPSKATDEEIQVTVSDTWDDANETVRFGLGKSW